MSALKFMELAPQLGKLLLLHFHFSRMYLPLETANVLKTLLGSGNYN